MANYSEILGAWTRRQEAKKRYHTECKALGLAFAAAFQKCVGMPNRLGFVPWEGDPKGIAPLPSIDFVLKVTDRGWYGFHLHLVLQREGQLREQAVLIPVEVHVSGSRGDIEIPNVCKGQVPYPPGTDDETLKKVAFDTSEALKADFEMPLEDFIARLGETPAALQRPIGFQYSPSAEVFDDASDA